MTKLPPLSPELLAEARAVSEARNLEELAVNLGDLREAVLRVAGGVEFIAGSLDRDLCGDEIGGLRLVVDRLSQIAGELEEEASWQRLRYRAAVTPER